MRFVGSKVYRAFPEFDDLSDSQCEAMMASAHERAAAECVSLVASLVMAFVIGICSFMILGGVVGAVGATLEWILDDAESSGVAIVVVAFGTMFPAVSGAFWTHRTWLRATMAEQRGRALCAHCDEPIFEAPVVKGQATCAACGGVTIVPKVAVRSALRCESCRYSLVGLPVADGEIRCPECETGFVLAEHRWTEEAIRGAESPGYDAS